jgi:hypothetical protein
VLWCTIRVRTVCESPAFEVGQTIRKTGRAETDHAEEVLNVFASTEKAEFTLGRVIDTLVHRKRVAPAIGLLAVAAAFSRSRHFMPVCVSSRTGS